MLSFVSLPASLAPVVALVVALVLSHSPLFGAPQPNADTSPDSRRMAQRRVLRSIPNGARINIADSYESLVEQDFSPDSPYSVMAKETGGTLTIGAPEDLPKFVYYLLLREAALESPGLNHYDLDLIFVVDTTPSVTRMIDSVRKNLHGVLEVVKKASQTNFNIRVGIATFDDSKAPLWQYDALTDDFPGLSRRLSGLTIGHGDTITNEKVYDAVIAVIETNKTWRGWPCRRLIVPISDGPARPLLLKGTPGLPDAIEAAQDLNPPITYYPFILKKKQYTRRPPGRVVDQEATPRAVIGEPPRDPIPIGSLTPLVVLDVAGIFQDLGVEEPVGFSPTPVQVERAYAEIAADVERSVDEVKQVLNSTPWLARLFNAPNAGGEGYAREQRYDFLSHYFDYLRLGRQIPDPKIDRYATFAPLENRVELQTGIVSGEFFQAMMERSDNFTQRHQFFRQSSAALLEELNNNNTGYRYRLPTRKEQELARARGWSLDPYERSKDHIPATDFHALPVRLVREFLPSALP